MKFSFFTIGHSTRPISEFIDLLTASEIGIVVDVRTVPRSRTNPQYDREALPESLSGFQIAYEHVAELGGLRARAKDIAPDVNAFWQNPSFHNYADYAMSGGFRSGLARLLDLGRVRRCAVMCAEAVWWRCHRRIIADSETAPRGHWPRPSSTPPDRRSPAAIPRFHRSSRIPRC